MKLKEFVILSESYNFEGRYGSWISSDSTNPSISVASLSHHATAAREELNIDPEVDIDLVYDRMFRRGYVRAVHQRQPNGRIQYVLLEGFRRDLVPVVKRILPTMRKEEIPGLVVSVLKEWKSRLWPGERKKEEHHDFYLPRDNEHLYAFLGREQ